MAKTVIGIDVGWHTLKAVCISGSAKAPTLSHVAMIPQTVMRESVQEATERAVASQLKDLINQLKCGHGDCHFAFNSSSAVLRYVETPYYPQVDLRASLKLNHQAFLRQSFENYVFDGICLFQDSEKKKKDKRDKKAEAEKAIKKGKTLIAGLPNAEVLVFFMAAKRAGLKPASFSLASLSLINGFELAYPQVFLDQSMLLLDIGHLTSILTIIHRGTVFLNRVIPLGGKNVLDQLSQNQTDPQQIVANLENHEALGEAIQTSLAPMIHDVHSSVNFFERNTDTDLNKIFLSGTLAKAPVVAEVIQKEVGYTCEAWDPSEGMKINLSPAQKHMFSENQAAFAVAVGTALTALQ